MSASLLRQLFMRPPGRLARYPSIPLEQALAEWRRLDASASAPKAPTPAEAPDTPSDDHLAQLATHLWRARQRLAPPPGEEDNAASRRVGRHLASATDTLELMQVVTKDWLNQPYDTGLPLRVLAFQPAHGITRDTIIEVVRPAILRGDRLLQSAEVVVGTPISS